MNAGAGRPVAFGHVGLQVTDVERSRTYYRDVIGLRELERLTRNDPYLGHVTGYPGLTLDICLLVEPASGVLLELLEYRDIDRRAVDPATANPGTCHVCFEVDDVDVIHARAVASGHGSVNAPVTPTSGRWAGGRSVYLTDPDGIRVELVQRGSAAPDAPVESEAVFLVEVRFAPDAAERRGPFRAEHLGRVAALKRSGVIIEGGAYIDALSTSLMLIRAEDAEAARQVALDDVYVAQGIWQDISVRPFGRVV